METLNEDTNITNAAHQQHKYNVQLWQHFNF